MNVKIEDVSNIKKKLQFEIDAEIVDTQIEKAYRKIGKTAKIKGFRPGKVPQKVLEQYYAPQMEQQVLTGLINDSYFKALVEHKIPAVSDPEIADSSSVEAGQPFTYEALVEVKPEVEAKDYTGLELEKEKYEFNDQVVEDQLREMQESRAQVEVSERDAARAGDSVVIDFKGFVDGEPFQNGSSEDYLLELGSGSFLPGFEEQLEGMKRGEERDIEVTFPETYGVEELAGKPAVFKVKLHEIKEKVTPELDDEFAKEFGVETIDQLRERIRENYEKGEKDRIEAELRERLMDALLECNPFEVPESMVEDQLKYMVENAKGRLKAQGLSMEMLGMTDEMFKANYREQAGKQVRGSLLLEAVARQEEIKVDEAEIDGKLTEISEMAGAPLDAVKKHYASAEARHGLVARIVEDKVFAFLLDKANVNEVEKDALQGAEEEKVEG